MFILSYKETPAQPYCGIMPVLLFSTCDLPGLLGQKKNLAFFSTCPFCCYVCLGRNGVWGLWRDDVKKKQIKKKKKQTSSFYFYCSLFFFYNIVLTLPSNFFFVLVYFFLFWLGWRKYWIFFLLRFLLQPTCSSVGHGGVLQTL